MIGANSFRENISKAAEPFALQGLQEYLLIATPAGDAYKKVMEEKQAFYLQYKQAVAIKTKPHITVSNFLARDEMEDTLVRWLQRIIGEQRSFRVTLNNFSGFPPHTVFLRVQDAGPFRELARQLKPIDAYIRDNACPPPRFIGQPHVSIARRLPADVYHEAIMDYAGKDFHESFEVDRLVLLRRRHRYDPCKEVAVLHLQPADDQSRN